jgi:hypothetical protein
VDTAEVLLSAEEAQLLLTPQRIQRVLPHLQCLRLRMTARAKAESLQSFCQGAATSLRLLKELQLLLTLPESPTAPAAFDMDLAGGCGGAA